MAAARNTPPAPRGAVENKYAIFQFASTHDTIAAERLAAEGGYGAEVIPQPPGKTGRCGVALRVAAADVEALREIFARGGLDDLDVERY